MIAALVIGGSIVLGVLALAGTWALCPAGTGEHREAPRRLREAAQAARWHAARVAAWRPRRRPARLTFDPYALPLVWARLTAGQERTDYLVRIIPAGEARP